MQADRHDRHQTDTQDRTGRNNTQTIVTAIAVLILAGGAYLLAPGDADESDGAASVQKSAGSAPSAIAPRPEPAPQIVAAPDIPAQTEMEPEETPQTVDETPPAPPTPEEIDAEIRGGVAESQLEIASALRLAYGAPYLLDRGTSSMDQIARGLVPARSLNLQAPKEKFAVTRSGQQRFLDPNGYDRYDNLVTAITALPTATLADLFHRFRPQLEAAYASLGYPAESMDNTLIAALDQVIAAPVNTTTLELETKGALYAFVDPELESASDLHKQLLRTGPDNTQRLQAWAATLKERLLRENGR